jgi:hypothetical protein
LTAVKAMAAFLISQRRFASDDPALARALAVAHLLHERPRCLCTAGGVPMYVAKAGRGYVLKRMPYTGSQHASLCSSHDVVSRSAATTRRPWPARQRRTTKDLQLLTRSEELGATLRTLWHAAELTRWQPGFEGKRSWATVRRHLLAAATTGNEPIAKRLYVPECFRAEQRDAIRMRRLELWQQICASCPDTERSIVLIGELKRLSPASHCFEAVIKHVPDARFALADEIYPWIGERFAADLAWWATSNEIRLVLIASCQMAGSDRLAIESLHLMPVTLQWLPVRTIADLTRVQRLVTSGCTFVARHPEPSGQSPTKTAFANRAQPTTTANADEIATKEALSAHPEEG